MFEHTKLILQKVSFDKNLFAKELKKSLKWLKKEEALMLKAWCIGTFGYTYKDAILEAFKSVNASL